MILTDFSPPPFRVTHLRHWNLPSIYFYYYHKEPKYSGVYRIFERGGRIEKGGARENFIRYFMKFDIFETIFSANLVHFIRKLARFPRICAQILFKTDIFNFFFSQKGGGARAQEPPPLYTPLPASFYV